MEIKSHLGRIFI